MQKKNIITFIKKIGVFILPIIGLIIWYSYSDPFKVVHTYDNYVNVPVNLNQGYVSWQNYLNHKDSLKYDSYILGNSCTMAYPTSVWNSFLKNASPIRLDANSESLYNIYKKIKRLDGSGVAISNILLVLDYGTLIKVSKNNSHMRILHPDVSYIRQITFQKESIAAFLNSKFLIAYIDYNLFKTYRKYMRGIIMEKDDHRDQLTNDIINPREFEIQKNQDQYWIKHKKEFPERNSEVENYSQIIYKRQKKMLSEIREIFKKHQTDYQIVINPEWNQKKFNTADLSELKKIFGESKVTDFSGKNSYTENKKFYYEKNHYRPLLGKKILNKIYS